MNQQEEKCYKCFQKKAGTILQWNLGQSTSFLRLHVGDPNNNFKIQCMWCIFPTSLEAGNAHVIKLQLTVKTSWDTLQVKAT